MAPALNPDQSQALAAFRHFLAGPCPCFILTGSAGTGKTTLIAEIAAELSQVGLRFHLLAPTGRAARILGNKTGGVAETIHRVIYSLSDVEVSQDNESPDDPGLRLVFPLKNENPGNAVFIVDEASMVGDLAAPSDMLSFGSSRLLADLVAYTRTGHPDWTPGERARLVFVGDAAQLPPVGERLSPALSPTYLKETFGIDSQHFALTQVMRQRDASEILREATTLRDAILKKRFTTFRCRPGGGEIRTATVSEAIEVVAESVRSGAGPAALVTYSNAQARDYNRAVRGRLLGEECAPPAQGDLLLVNSNSPKTGLFNGDLVKVLHIGADAQRRRVNIRGLAGAVELAFRSATIGYRDTSGAVNRIECLLLENLLDSPQRDLSPIEQRALFVDFRQRHPELRTRTAEFRLALRNDPFFNALRVKYGYALTCHKAQGGEWNTVVVDFGSGRGLQNEHFFRWAYTAITRAKLRLYTIGAPDFDEHSAMNWGDPPQAVQASTAAAEPRTDERRDPDWNRFSFRAGQEALFQFHLALREAWMSRDIAVESLDHLQYCERYGLARGGARAVVQYWYRADGRVSRAAALPGNRGDPHLAEEALATMQAALPYTRNPQGDSPASVQAFEQRIAAAASRLEARLVGAEHYPYRLRATFEANGQRTKIDFHYDGKQRWTRVEEVGGPGTSLGFIQRLEEAFRPNTP